VGQLAAPSRETGETPMSIAKKIGVTAAAIADANSVERSAALDAAEKLIIPATQPQSETKRRLVSYRVRRGDTFLGIATRFSVDAEALRQFPRTCRRGARDSSPAGAFVSDCGCVAGMISFSPASSAHCAPHC